MHKVMSATQCAHTHEHMCTYIARAAAPTAATVATQTQTATAPAAVILVWTLPVLAVLSVEGAPIDASRRAEPVMFAASYDPKLSQALEVRYLGDDACDPVPAPMCSIGI